MVTITVNGMTTQAQVVDRVSALFFLNSALVIYYNFSVRAVVLKTWISVLVSSITLEVPTAKVSCTAPGLSAVIQCPRPLLLNSQNPLRSARAPFQAEQALPLSPLLNLPRAPVRVLLPLLPLLLLVMSQPPFRLECLLKACSSWVNSVNWC